MAVTTEMIKELRTKTGAGVLDCKKALDSSAGDMAKAEEILKEKGLAAAAKKADRTAADGRVEAYVHTGDKLAVLVAVNCETDFVARTDQFKELCHNIAMQVAAFAPKWVSRAHVPADVLEAEKASYAQEFEGQNKPAQIIERIIEGKLEKFYAENCLLDQAYIRDDEKTIGQLVTEAIAALGENIIVKDFSRLSID